jgi:myosin heavy subunit
LLQKLHSNHYKNSLYIKPRKAEPIFGVTHYSGTVTYDISGWLEKNRDTLSQLILETCLISENSLVKELFSGEEGSDKKTVSFQFKESLAALMTTLSATSPHFVRCIKPNMDKKPVLFERELVLAQLRYFQGSVFMLITNYCL